MKKILLLTLIACQFIAFAQTIWTGPSITFTKASSSDVSLETNQDRISDAVWITRGATKGIYNIKTETSYEGSSTSGNSPQDTEWAFGSTSDDVKKLTFTTWAIAANGSPTSLIGKQMVVHLISEDIYLNVKFTNWTQNSFTYERASKTVTGIQQKQNESFNVYPNPVKNVLNFTKDATISIFDITGNLILTKNQSSSVDVSFLKNGIYFIKTDDNVVIRFIKE